MGRAATEGALGRENLLTNPKGYVMSRLNPTFEPLGPDGGISQLQPSPSATDEIQPAPHLSPIEQLTEEENERLNKMLEEWFKTLLFQAPETKAAAPVDIVTKIIARLAAGGQPFIKALTGFFKASLVSQCMPFNIFLVVCRAVSGYATGGAGTYENMTTPEKKAKERRDKTHKRVHNYLKQNLSFSPTSDSPTSDSPDPDSPTLTATAIANARLNTPIPDRAETLIDPTLRRDLRIVPSQNTLPSENQDSEPHTPTHKVPSTGNLTQSTDCPASSPCTQASTPTEATSSSYLEKLSTDTASGASDLEHISALEAGIDTLGEAETVEEVAMEATEKTEIEAFEEAEIKALLEDERLQAAFRLKKKEALAEIQQALIKVLNLNIGPKNWDYIFKKSHTKWATTVTDTLLQARKDVVFGQWEKFIAHFITPFAWIGGSVFSCLSTYGVYTVCMTAFCFPPFAAIILAAITLVLSMIMSMTFYRNQISTAFLTFGKTLDNEGLYGLLVWKNILIALSSAITMPALLFMSIHTPLMAIIAPLALQIGIAASIMNPIGIIVCAVLVAITTIAAIGANHSQASKCEKYFQDLKKLYNEQQGVTQTAIFCFAALIGLAVSAAALAISIFGDLGGFQQLTHVGFTASCVFGAFSFVANASFMLADTVYNTTESVHRTCKGAAEYCKGAAERWGFFSSPQAGPQRESAEARIPLTASPAFAPAA